MCRILVRPTITSWRLPDRVDSLSTEGERTEIRAAEILALLSFRMSSTDSEFLARYLPWRIANPIPK